MAMTNSGRANAIYNQMPNLSMLSSSEKSTLLTTLIAVFGTGDLTYITGNAQVNPGTLANPVGQPVATTGTAVAQTGATTAPATITGLGTVS